MVKPGGACYDRRRLIDAMKIALLTRNLRLYSTDRLAGAATERGHHVMLIDPLACYMSVTAEVHHIHYRGESLIGFDAVLPRIGSSFSFYGAAVVRQFETMGVYAVNGSSSITLSRDKFAAMQILANGGIPLPITGFAHSTAHTDDLIDLVGGPPLVVKLLEGTQGIGVVLTETRQAAQSVIEAFRGLKANILVQEFISEAAGEDLRCIVVGDRVVAAMRRRSTPGEFRANLHRGASAAPVELTDEEEEIAVRSARLLGLRVAGVDQLRSRRGPLVIEVNSSPGLEGIEATSRTDVATAIIEFLEEETRSHRGSI
jgi:ribosomal protein S6--L-glutamate ligase